MFEGISQKWEIFVLFVSQSSSNVNMYALLLVWLILSRLLNLSYCRRILIYLMVAELRKDHWEELSDHN